MTPIGWISRLAAIALMGAGLYVGRDSIPAAVALTICGLVVGGYSETLREKASEDR